MKKNTLDIIEYLVEYTDLLTDTAQEIAEKILFDGSIDDLDALERQSFSKDIEPLLAPACRGALNDGCPTSCNVEDEFVLECYQSSLYLCRECRQMSELRKAS